MAAGKKTKKKVNNDFVEKRNSLVFRKFLDSFTEIINDSVKEGILTQRGRLEEVRYFFQDKFSDKYDGLNGSDAQSFNSHDVWEHVIRIINNSYIENNIVDKIEDLITECEEKVLKSSKQ